MKKTGITVFLVVLTVIIGGVMGIEFLSERPGRQPDNPFALQMDSLIAVNPDLILYKEVRNLKLDMEDPLGISRVGNMLAVTGAQRLIVLDLAGKLLKNIALDADPFCVKATADRFYIGTYKKVVVLDQEGKMVSTWNNLYENSIVTSIDVYGDKVFVADAGKRLVYRFDTSGIKELEFDGKTGVEGSHGFIVPSPNFDLAIDQTGDFWVVNPGKHELENFSFEGRLRGWWGGPTAGIKGFSGCCNPAHFTFLPDGNFVTSEKGVVRIKVYKPSGELFGVVASSAAFAGEQHAPDLATDEQGRIYALDMEKRMIRVFEKK